MSSSKEVDFKIIDNYDLVSDSYEWLEWLKNKKFNFHPRPTKQKSKKLKFDPGMEFMYQSIKRRVFGGLDHLSREARVASWMILLNIDIEAPEIEGLRMDYLTRYMLYQTQSGSEEERVEKQIVKDCIRTFTETK